MSHFYLRAAALSVLLALVAMSNAQQPLPTSPLPRPAGEPQLKFEPMERGIQVADKGPIHEAFAQPGAETRGQGITAPKAPPPPIPEEPPETKPDGANVHWVPGYWQWDTAKEEFLWVSGFWRNFPAGRDWQAGKWTTNTKGQYQYAPGFWRPTNMNSWRVDLPAPPTSVENGPSTPPNDPNAIWIPGSWEYRNQQYVWRAGYWAHPNGNNLWQPGQYVETGSGFAYVPGFWDYPLEDRGLLYPPVYFDRPLWQTAGWRFRPRLAFGLGLGWNGWGTGGFFNSLWIDPGFNNYCYGNYYNSWGNGFYSGFGSPFWGSAFGIGFGFGNSFCGWGGCRPWWGTCRGFSNPLWNQYCWLNRGNPNWAANVQSGTVARGLGAAPRSAILANGAGTPSQLAVAPQGVGGAVQTVARSAALTAAKPQPLIQPASQVARSLQTGRANLDSALPSAAGRAMGDLNHRSSSQGNTNAVGRPGPGNANALSGAMRPTQATPPIHAGSVQFTQGDGSQAIRPGNAANLNRPDVAGTNIGNLNRPNGLPLQPNGGNAVNPAMQINPRSGSLPTRTLPSSSVIGGGRSGMPSLPSAPAFRGMPSMGGGRSLPISPSGGRSMGSFGGRSMGGGGGRSMGGGGRGGGKH